ncbi:DUF1120 domain-containing protein [Pseudomonas sp. SDO528_S397]
MIKTAQGAALTLLSALAPHALAASSTDLRVEGLITPSACTPSLTRGGVVDYGKLAASDLLPDTSTWLAPSVLQLAVSCTAPTLFALRGRDNRPGTAHKDDGYGYGLGLINGDQKLGTYLLTVRNPLADSMPVQPLMSLDGGASWWLVPDGTWLVAHQLAAFGNRATGTPAPIPLQALTTELHIEPSIAPANSLTLTGQVTLDGSATVDVIYL